MSRTQQGPKEPDQAPQANEDSTAQQTNVGSGPAPASDALSAEATNVGVGLIEADPRWAGLTQEQRDQKNAAIDYHHQIAWLRDKVMAAVLMNPEIKIWLYGNPLEPRRAGDYDNPAELLAHGCDRFAREFYAAQQRIDRERAEQLGITEFIRGAANAVYPGLIQTTD